MSGAGVGGHSGSCPALIRGWLWQRMAGQIVPNFILQVGQGPLQDGKDTAGRADGECFLYVAPGAQGRGWREAAMSVLQLVGGS